jgi:peptidyl-prolyl cis-trans isomerase D
MLSAFRSKGLTQVVYGVVIVATVLVFVIQFNPSAGKKTASLGEQCAARVRGWCIGPKDHLAAYRILIPRGPQGELQTGKAKQMGLMKIALDGLIERELLLGEAERIGISVTDDEVTDEIFNGFIHVSVPSDNPGLAPSLNVMDGKVYAGFKDTKTKRFDLKVYERSIKAIVGRSPTEFREEQARELIAAKVRDLVRIPVRVSEGEALESYIDEKSTANITYVQVRQSWAAKYAVPTPPVDVDAWAKDASNQGIIDAGMKARSTNHIRHILAKFGNAPGTPPTDAEKKAAKGKIDRAQARLKAGEPFTKVAKEMSEDGSAQNGGDVGEKTDGFVPPFREAADKLNPGQVTPEPVETEFGYHLIMKEAPKTDAQLAELKKDVTRELYVKTKAPDVAKAIADRILTAIKGGRPADDVVKDVLAPMAASYAAAHPPAPAAAASQAAPHRPASGDAGAGDAGAGDAGAAAPPPPKTDTPDTDPTRPQVISSSAFTQGGDPIPTLPAEATTRLMKFAFDPATKDGDVLGESLKADDGFTVVELKQHKTATKEEFAKDRDTYLQTLVARKQAEALSLYVKRLKEESKNDIKVDDKYMAEKTGSKDGGAAPVPTEEEEEGP